MRNAPSRRDARRSGFAPALALALVACAGGGDGNAPPAEAPAPAAVPAEPGRPFDLPYGRTASVADGALTIAFRRLVEESRCPEGVQCPAAGNAAAELAVETAGGAAATLVLNTARRPGEAPAHGWRVRLEGLAPAPVAGAPVDTAAYVASLLVDRSP